MVLRGCLTPGRTVTFCFAMLVFCACGVGAAEAPAADQAAWPPPAFAPDPNLAERHNLAAMLDYLAGQAGKHDDLKLLGHHFRSCALVVRECGASDPDEVHALYQSYMADWGAGPADWKTYLAGRPLIFAWKDATDGQVGVTTVTLPKAFEPDRAYPLFFELHGGGGNAPIDKQTMHYLLLEHGVGAARSNAHREGIHVYPLARGTAEYSGGAKRDLDSCLREVDRFLVTDPARQHMFGFSMGGGGTWDYGAASEQDRGWAALAVICGTTQPSTYEAQILKDTPFFIRTSPTDPWHRFSEAMNQRLEDAGNRADFESIEGNGHSYKGELQDAAIAFMLAHTNPHPVLPACRSVVVHAFGDDGVAELFVNGRRVEIAPGETSGLAMVHAGTNVVAAHVVDCRWASSFTLGLALPSGKAVGSEASYKCSVLPPPVDWSSPDFDDSAWPAAGDQGTVADYIGAGTVPAWASELAPYGAHVLGPPAKLFLRRTFDASTADATLRLVAQRCRYTVYLNGERLVQGELGQEKGPEVAKPITALTVQGRNVIALELEHTGKGPMMAKGALFYVGADGRSKCAASGPGWRVAQAAVDGWTAPSFDDSAWPVTDAGWLNYAFDAGDNRDDGTFLTMFMSPGDQSYRGRFEVAAEDLAPAAGGTMP